MKVFLTGGTGFIGQPLTKALLTRGWSVTALVRKPNTPQAQGLGKIGAQLSTGDVTERESMRTAMNSADIVPPKRCGSQQLTANLDCSQNEKVKKPGPAIEALGDG